MHRMVSLALGLFDGDETELLTLEDDLHLQTDVIVSVGQGLHAIVEHENIHATEQSPRFLILK